MRTSGDDIIKKLARTVFIVTVMSCVERAIGFLYRVFLSRNMGAEGLGLYQIALSVIGVLITVSASGILITVSRLMIKEKTAKNPVGENQTVSSGILTSLLVCVPLCGVFYIFKDALEALFADNRCNSLFLIILPGVIITSVYAVIRGFFWGTKSFYTYSAIELAEEAVMTIIGIIAVSRVTEMFDKAVWASAAVLLSYVFSFITANIMFFIKGGRLKNPLPKLKPLVVSSTPITFMRASTSLTSSLIALILPAALIAGGMTNREAISVFGVMSGMTLPLLFIPSTIIGSISLVLVPELSENFYKKNSARLKNNVEKALLYSLLVSVLIVPLFIGVGKYFGNFVYDNQLSGIYLAFSAPVMLPMSITMISTSLLNSMGMERKTLLYYLIGASLLLLSIWILPRYLGVYALVIGFAASYTVSGALNLLLLKKICCNKLAFFKKSAVALVVCILGSALCYFMNNVVSGFLSGFISAAISCAITLACVCGALVLLGVFNPKELNTD